MLVADDHAQPEIVALGALRFLNGAVANLDRERYRADRERISVIGAGAARGSHQAFGELGEIGLVEKRLHFLAGLCGERDEHKAKMELAGGLFNPRLDTPLSEGRQR